MKFLKLFFNFYINASIHVAFAVYALISVTKLYFDLNYQNQFNYFIFFGSITGYNFVKYAGVAKLHHRSLTEDLKIIQIFSFFCFLATCYFATQISVTTLIYALPFVVLTLLYAVPFLSGFHKNLRGVSYLKIIVVALVWAGFTVLIPVINSGQEIVLDTVLLFLQRFLIVLVFLKPSEETLTLNK